MSAGDVRVHLVDLAALAACVPEADAIAWLDDAERVALACIRAPSRRLEFAHGRAVLKRLLAEGAGAAPDAVRLVAGVHGKPAVAPDRCDGFPAFNVSHADGWLAVALAEGGDVGVDLESGRAPQGMAAIARRHFSPAEYAAFDAARPEDRAATFLRAWTLKEAMAKATGTGLRGGLRRWDTAMAVRVRIDGVDAEHHFLDMRDLAPERAHERDRRDLPRLRDRPDLPRLQDRPDFGVDPGCPGSDSRLQDRRDLESNLACPVLPESNLACPVTAANLACPGLHLAVARRGGLGAVRIRIG